jgi:hypothetical protein
LFVVWNLCFFSMLMRFMGNIMMISCLVKLKIGLKSIKLRLTIKICKSCWHKLNNVKEFNNVICFSLKIVFYISILKNHALNLIFYEKFKHSQISNYPFTLSIFPWKNCKTKKCLFLFHLFFFMGSLRY